MNCVNCHQPLKLDDSLTEKYPEWRTLNVQLTSLSDRRRSAARQNGLNGDRSMPHNAAIKKPDETASKPRMLAGSNFSNSGSSDISVVGRTLETTLAGPTMGQQMVQIGNLFDIITSSDTAIDSPLCQDCTNKLLDNLDQQLNNLEEECQEYTKLLDNLNQCQKDLDLDCLKRELEKLQTEESELRAELTRLETEESELDSQLTVEQKELDKAKKEEESLWLAYRDCNRQLQDINDEHASVSNQLRYAQEQLEKLQRTNVFNLAFHIWHNGHFGTINGFRLGRLPNVIVDWAEINAAWGQTVLLLSSLAKRIGLQLERFELVPFGNHSYIKCLDDGRVLPLFCAGGYKFFWDNKFDAAMVAFLDCLQQLKEAVAKGDSGFLLPYRMSKDKIIIEDAGVWNEYSVKIQFNSEERWTKAMKYMLTNLKWALAWVSSQHA